ncbi:hypothetical protein ACR9LV_07940 [Helicobacter pylori]
MRLLNRDSYKKGFFNFDCFGFAVIYCKNGFLNCKNDFLNCKNDFLNCKNDFLNFLKRSVWQPFLPKTQGLACKSGATFEFWLHAVKLSLAWHKDTLLF